MFWSRGFHADESKKDLLELKVLNSTVVKYPVGFDFFTYRSNVLSVDCASLLVHLIL